MTRENEKLFSQGSIPKVLIKFSIPAVLSLLVTELYNMVDTVFVGRAVGGNAIGALVVVFPIQRIIAALSMMFAIGTSTAVARNNGEGNKKGIASNVESALTITTTVLIPITIIIFAFKEPILRLMGASDIILPYAVEYLSYIIWGSVFICLTGVMNYSMMSLGNRKITIASNATGAIMNIIVDYILVMGFNMGVKGAAIATLLSQIAAFCMSAYVFRKTVKHNDMKLKPSFNKAIIAGIIAVGFSAFIVEAEDGILMAFLNNLLLNNVGDEGVIVLGIISKVSMFLFITMLGIGSAMQPIAAYNLGAKNYKRLKRVMLDTILFALITSGILWLVTYTFAQQIISIFVDDPYIIGRSVDAFRTMVSIFPILSVYYVSIYFYQAVGKGRASFVISILRQLIVMLPLSVILVKGFELGAYGVWLSYPISDGISGVISIILMWHATKEIDKYIAEDKETVKSENFKQVR